MRTMTPEFQAEVEAYKKQFLRTEKREYTLYNLKGTVKLTLIGAALGLVAAIGWVLA